MLHSRVGSWPYPQTVDQAGNNCQGQTLQLITKIHKLRTKIFYNIGPWCQHQKTFFPSLARISHSHGQLQLTGQNLGRVFNFRFVHLQAKHFRCCQVKLPNLKSKAWPTQLLGSLPLVITLHARALPLPKNIKPVWKGQAGTNTLCK